MQLLMQKLWEYHRRSIGANFFQMLLSEINQKHVLTYFHGETTQIAAESFNMAGRIAVGKEVASILKYEEGNGWDYIHVNNSNMAGANPICS